MLGVWLLSNCRLCSCCHHFFVILGLLSFPGFGLLLGCWGYRDCCWFVLAMLGPRKTLKNYWPELCFTLWFGVVTLLTSSSSQSCELFVLLQYAVVGLRTVESRIRGWVCLRKLVFEATSLAFSLSYLLDNLVKPYCVGLADWKTLAMCKPALTLILGRIIPRSGVVVCWEIDEHAGLWLGGTLQWRSWLREKFFIRR